MRYTHGFLLVAMLCGCSEEIDSEPEELSGLAAMVAQSLEERGLPTDSISVIEAMLPAGVTYSQASLCELAWAYEGAAGRYRVQELVSTQEAAGEFGDIFTYALLAGETLDGEPSEVIVRVPGGVLNSDLAQTGLISLETGEELVAFTLPPSADQNHGFASTWQGATFDIDADGSVVGQRDRWENLTAFAQDYADEIADPPIESEPRDISNERQYAQLAEACMARQ